MEEVKRVVVPEYIDGQQVGMHIEEVPSFNRDLPHLDSLSGADRKDQRDYGGFNGQRKSI